MRAVPLASGHDGGPGAAARRSAAGGDPSPTPPESEPKPAASRPTGAGRQLYVGGRQTPEPAAGGGKAHPGRAAAGRAPSPAHSRASASGPPTERERAHAYAVASGTALAHASLPAWSSKPYAPARVLGSAGLIGVGRALDSPAVGKAAGGTAGAVPARPATVAAQRTSPVYRTARAMTPGRLVRSPASAAAPLAVQPQPQPPPLTMHALKPPALQGLLGSPYRSPVGPPSPKSAALSQQQQRGAAAASGGSSAAPGSPIGSARQKQQQQQQQQQLFIGQVPGSHRSSSSSSGGGAGAASLRSALAQRSAAAGRNAPGSLHHTLAVSGAPGSAAGAAAAAAAAAYRSVKYGPAAASAAGRSSSSKPSSPTGKRGGSSSGVAASAQQQQHDQQQQRQQQQPSAQQLHTAASGKVMAAALHMHAFDGCRSGSALSMHSAGGFAASSSSFSTARPSTARGSSRCEARAVPSQSQVAPPERSGSGSGSATPPQAADLDVRSWSAFLRVGGAPQPPEEPPPAQAAGVARPISAAAQQMLRDLGLGLGLGLGPASGAAGDKQPSTSGRAAGPQRPASAGGARAGEPQPARFIGGGSILDARAEPAAAGGRVVSGPLSSSLRRSRTSETPLSLPAASPVPAAAAPPSPLPLRSSSVQRRMSFGDGAVAPVDAAPSAAGPLHAGLLYAAQQRAASPAWVEVGSGRPASASEAGRAAASEVANTPEAAGSAPASSRNASAAISARDAGNAAPAPAAAPPAGACTPPRAGPSGGGAAAAHQLLRFVQTQGGGLRRWSAADPPLLAAGASPARTARSDSGGSPAGGLARRGSGEGSLAGGDTRGTLTALRGSNAWTVGGAESSADMSVASSDLVPGSPAVASTTASAAALSAGGAAEAPATSGGGGGAGPSPLGGSGVRLASSRFGGPASARRPSEADGSPFRAPVPPPSAAPAPAAAPAAAPQRRPSTPLLEGAARQHAAPTQPQPPQQQTSAAVPKPLGEFQQQQPQPARPASAAGRAGPRTADAAPTAGPSRPSGPGGAPQGAASSASSGSAASSASRASSAGGAPRRAAAAVKPPADAPAPAPAAPAAAAPAAAADADAAAGDGGPGLLPGYSVGRVVGEGGFCQVRLGVHHLSRRKVAVKVLDKSRLGDANEARRVAREVRVLRRLRDHPCVIRLFEVVDSGERLHLVMEYARGGSLLDHVRAKKRLGEAEAAAFLVQTVSALAYCHDSEVVHRDVKLENILLDGSGAIKVIDFGLAAFFTPGRRLRVHCGSPSYAAPEIVARRSYEGPPVDVWSLGVVLFAMVAGFLPFHSPTGNKQELCQKILAGTYNTPEWLSPGVRDLLGRMLCLDPERRATLGEVAGHAWCRAAAPAWVPPPSVYAVTVESGTGAVSADEAVLAELEAHGYSRASTLRHLANGDANYAVASYCLLAEALAEAGHKAAPAPQPAWAAAQTAAELARGGGSAVGGARRPAAAAAAAAGESAGAARPGTAGGGALGQGPAVAVAAF
ncbi:hypothetical protein Rsub_01133 [Raphidocelis subcapitata]|uniref:Protein kinase domain-containing protein n=1 Tax=Raphidocelis subcapitata TaxID=307507 RepID=A0A2V0NLV7_9CHLO|nr:hypothetical protein Rsub_01133 [Raphidocelis subcapitata]|eukprot:GBF88421.1 hypothetical protein Rsub_01133 [Raphidocelis subcapitata]